MAISTAICTSFKREILVGTHDFTPSTGDTFKIALYDSTAVLDASTTAYTTTGEITGTGYTAGGNTLVTIAPTTSGTTAIVDFDDSSWTGDLTANGALIYNASKSNKAVCVLAFGLNRTSIDNSFVVKFPAADAGNAVVRIA